MSDYNKEQRIVIQKILTAQNTKPGQTGTPDFGRNSDPFGGEPMEISDDVPF